MKSKFAFPVLLALFVAPILANLFLSFWLFPGAYRMWFGDVALAVQSVVLAAALLALAWQMRPFGMRKAYAWLAIALAYASYAAGDTAWAILEFGLHIDPFPSIADVFYLLFYPLMVAGIGLLPAQRVNVRRLAADLLDIAVITGASALFLWNFVLSPQIDISRDEPFLSMMVIASYPIADLVLIIALLVLIYRRLEAAPAAVGAPGYQPFRQMWAISRPQLFLGLAVLLMVVLDIIYAIQVINETYISGTWLDALYSGTFYLTVLAAILELNGLRAQRAAARELDDQALLADIAVPDAAGADPHIWRHYLPYLWLGLAYTQLVFVAELEQAGYLAGVAIWVGVLTGLIVLRQMLTLYENSRLSIELTQSLAVLRTQAVELARVNTQLQLEVEERKKTEQRAIHNSLHDALTGLPNRVLYLQRLKEAALVASSLGRSNAVFMIDLNGFKQVNDTLGHAYGDRLLEEVAWRFLRVTRPQDTIARLGGDEFALLVVGVTRTEAEEIARRLLRQLEQPILLNHHPVRVTASIGVVFAEGRTEPGDLLRDADLTMYQLKGLGENAYLFFNPEMRAEFLQNLPGSSRG